MKLHTLHPLLPLLAAPALASTNPSSDPTPLGALWTSTWTNTTLTPFTKSCTRHSTHHAKIFKLADLYPTLESYAPQLKVFYNQQPYPGSWEGVDKHGNERELLMMRVQELPGKVREWIRGEGTQRLFSVHEDEEGDEEGVVFFAPGAVYPYLPLWVDGGEGGCEGAFDALDRYSNEPADGKTIGKVSHKAVGKGEVEFTVEALRVELAKDGERSEL